MDTVPTHDGFSPVKAIEEGDVGSPQNLQLRTFTVSSRSRPISHEIVNAMPCQIIDELEVLTLSP